jgi:MscS family membrane protein
VETVVSRRLFVSFLFLLASGSAAAASPLEPVDTSSPRATMASFSALVEEISRRYNAYRDAPSPVTQHAVVQATGRTLQLFNLSEVPPATRRKVGPRTFYLLADVLARIELPPLEEIPAAPVKSTAVEAGKQSNYWRIPHTDITIARVEAGADAGEYLFTAETVRRAREFYESARELPYVRPTSAQDLYQLNRSLTGWMIPMTWVESLPAWASTSVLDVMLWKWTALLMALALAAWTALAVFRWGRRGPHDASLRSFLRTIYALLAILALVYIFSYFVLFQINVSGTAAEIPQYLIAFANELVGLCIIWVTARWGAEAIIASPQINPFSLDASLIRLTGRVIGFFALLVVLLRLAHGVGVPVYGLVAGAGVGGVAVALAARSTLENFLGTLNLFGDRPIAVGDFCRYGADGAGGLLRVGTVEEIGLRSTRIRGIDRTITTIPNAEFCNMHIVNLTQRDRMLFKTVIGLRYETTPEQLRFVLAAIREMLLAHPRIDKEPARVRAIGFGQSSLDMEIFAYVKTSDWNDFLAVQEDLVLRIMQIVRDAGTSFAFPSRTVYHARDSGLDGEKQQAAEQTVREWAAAHVLPFPEFSDDHRRQILDTLDYPPAGSPGQKGA